MNTIGSNLEEKLQKQFNYVHQPVSKTRKLFDKLKAVCVVKGVRIKVKNHKVKGVLIRLHRSGTTVGDYWAKPIIMHGRIYLKFPKVGLIDASYVDLFGEDIHVV